MLNVQSDATANAKTMSSQVSSPSELEFSSKTVESSHAAAVAQDEGRSWWSTLKAVFNSLSPLQKFWFVMLAAILIVLLTFTIIASKGVVVGVLAPAAAKLATEISAGVLITWLVGGAIAEYCNSSDGMPYVESEMSDTVHPNAALAVVHAAQPTASPANARTPLLANTASTPAAALAAGFSALATKANPSSDTAAPAPVSGLSHPLPVPGVS